MPLASQVGVASRQLSLMMVTNPGGPCSSKMGSARALGTPNWAREGPIARTRTCFCPVPVIMKPPMPTLAVCTSMRVDRFSERAALGPEVADAVGVGVVLAIGVAVAVAVAVTVAVAVAVGVGLGVAPSQAYCTVSIP